MVWCGVITKLPLLKNHQPLIFHGSGIQTYNNCENNCHFSEALQAI